MIEFNCYEKTFRIENDNDIEDVYLFGSFARGEADEYSDMDILVVIQDCGMTEYAEKKRYLSNEWNIPDDWLSLYEVGKVKEMAKKGSYFLWHVKLEGKCLFSKNGFLEKQLSELKQYQSVLEDLDEYEEICRDIAAELDDVYLDVSYELSVLASIIRNTAIAIDYMSGKPVFGRNSAVQTCNELLKGKYEIALEEYQKLYTHRLHQTKKMKAACDMKIEDLKGWLNTAKELIGIGKEIYHERKNVDDVG